MSKIKAEIIPNKNNNKLGHLMMICGVDDYDMIFNKIMRMNNGDKIAAGNAAAWCESATVGEIYEFPEGTIEIKERA